MSATPDEYERLLRLLRAPELGLGLMLVRYEDPRVGGDLCERAREELQERSVAILDLDDADDDVDILARVASASTDADVVFIVGLEHLLLEFGVTPRASRAIATFNYNRDLIGERVGKPLVLWMSFRAARAFALRARDTFDVVQASFDFPVGVGADRRRERLEERLGLIAAQYGEAVGGNQATAADLAAQAARVEVELGHGELARAWNARAAAGYEASGDPGSAAAQLIQGGRQAIQRGDYMDAGADLTRALALAKAAGDLDLELDVQLASAEILAHREGYDAALELIDQVATVAETRGREPQQTAAYARRAEIMSARGELGEALSLYRGQIQVIEAKAGSWAQRVKLDLAAMGKAVAKGVVDLATGNWAGVAKGTVDLAASLGRAESAAEQAAALLTRAMTRAVLDLVDPYKMDFPADIATHEPEVAAVLRGDLDAIDLHLDASFLERPRELPFVATVQARVEAWLSQVDLDGRPAKTIAARLPAYFVHALHRECAEHDYARLFDVLDGAFSQAWRDERSWLAYEDWVRRELDAPVFEEGFGLAQIFVWPRAYHLERDPDADEPVRRGELHEPCSVRVLGWLRERLDGWLEAGDRGDCVRVISGDPGAGKSSFARMYGAHRMARGDRVLIVPLHHLELEASLEASLASLCRLSAPYPELSLEREPSLLLILDGLDELAKRGKLGAALAREFVEEVLSTVERRNLGSEAPRLRVVISGRPVAIADVVTKFRREGQVLHLVPYCLTEVERGRKDWRDESELRGLDQRPDWWWSYGALTGRGYEGIPEALAGDDLIETTAQPLLSYLLAFVCKPSGDTEQDFGTQITRSEIYRLLIDRIYERDWAKREGGRAGLGGLSREEFRELLEDMALATWHDRSRVTSVAAVEKLATPAVLRKYTESTGGVSSLFTVFYLRKYGHDAEGEDTFEFTHKSFAEYLTACRLVAQLELAAVDLADHDKSMHGRRREGKDEAGVLLDWLDVFGPMALSLDLLPYLREEVARRGVEQARAWQLALVRLIEHVLGEGAICGRPPEGLNVAEIKRWTRNAEEGLLVLLSCCSSVTEELSRIRWPRPDSFATWVRWLIPQRAMGALRCCAGEGLTRLDLHDQVLGLIELVGARLDGADLSNVSAAGVNFLAARLRGADLSNANLNHANLNYSSLKYANLSNANLNSANLLRASLKNANLNSANLKNANLSHAALSNASLKNANLSNAILDYTILDKSRP